MDDEWYTALPYQPFEHEPLDPGPSSIRLVKIGSHRDSDGRIECCMRLASVEDDYTCLSYVWGDPNHGQCIIVNGKELFVRDNLWNFLDRAASLPQLKTRSFWIDAICINQSNVHERQHQVQHMGQIYSGAREVVSWLGMSPSIAGFLSELRLSHDANPSYWLAFSQYTYWQRAWITQEFVLAREIKLMARSILRSFGPWLHSQNNGEGMRSWTSNIRVPSNMPKVFTTRDLHWRPKAQEAQPDTLLQLLDDHGHKQCHIRRDKIFALLGLCSENRRLDVDYTISHADLALNVLQSCSTNFCLCTLSLIANTLDLQSSTDMHQDGIPAVFSSKLRGTLALPITWNRIFGKYLFGEETQASDEGLTGAKSEGSDHKWAGKITILELTEVDIRIDLDKICPYFVGSVWVRCSFGSNKCSYEATNIELAKDWPMDDNMRLEVFEDGGCVFSFSMDFWLFVIHRARREKFGRNKCCPRIYGHDTYSNATSTYPGVELSEAISGPVRRYSVPSEVTKFVRYVTRIGMEQEI